MIEMICIIDVTNNNTIYYCYMYKRRSNTFRDSMNDVAATVIDEDSQNFR